MRVRYTGPDGPRYLVVPGGSIECPVGQWVDVPKALKAAGIPETHGEIAVRGLAGQGDWDVELDEKRSPRKTTTHPDKEAPAEPDGKDES